MELTKEHLDQKFEKLYGFLNDNMVTKTELEEMRKEVADKKDVNQILTSVDGIAKQMNDYNTDLPAIRQEIQNINDWIREAAKRIGVEYKP